MNANSVSAEEQPTGSAASSSAPAVSRPKPNWIVKVVALLACLLTLWHVGASFLWIAPYSALREIPTQKVLASYMLPFFGQSWSVFAPEPINGDYHFNVRAVIEKDGEEVETGWVSATDVELSMIEYNLFPPRAGIQSTEIASGQMNAYNKLTDQQQEIIALDYVAEDWEEWMVRSFDELEGESLPATEAYMEAEHLATTYATQVAYAMWGGDVVQVQYRVSRQNVVPYAQRNDPNATRPEPTKSTSGWRTPTEEAGQSRKDFADVFVSQYERSTR